MDQVLRSVVDVVVRYGQERLAEKTISMVEYNKYVALITRIETEMPKWFELIGVDTHVFQNLLEFIRTAPDMRGERTASVPEPRAIYIIQTGIRAVPSEAVGCVVVFLKRIMCYTEQDVRDLRDLAQNQCQPAIQALIAVVAEIKQANENRRKLQHQDNDGAQALATA